MGTMDNSSENGDNNDVVNPPSLCKYHSDQDQIRQLAEGRPDEGDRAANLSAGEDRDRTQREIGRHGHHKVVWFTYSRRVEAQTMGHPTAAARWPGCLSSHRI
jgi:hypothetical protein